MLRLSKKADYALIAMKHLAQKDERGAVDQRARDCRAVRHPDRADGQGAAAARADGLLVSTQGTRGGYTLSRPSASISVADVIQAIDGPFTVTACSTDKHDCEQYSKCSIRDPLWQIRERIVAALGMVSIAEMAADSEPATAAAAESPSCAGAGCQQARATARDRDDDEASDLHGLPRHHARRSAGARGDAAVLHPALRQRRQPQPRVRLGSRGSGGDRAQAGGRSDRRQRRRKSSSRAAPPSRTTWRSRASRRCTARRATTSSPASPSTRRSSTRARSSRSRARASPICRCRRTAASASTSCAPRSPTRRSSSRS